MKTLLKRSSTTSTASMSDSEEMEIDRPMSLVDLIAESKWNVLRKVLDNDGDGDGDENGSVDSFREEASTNTILHKAIQLGAPKNVLLLLAERFHETLSQTDHQGRYPIHVACASGSSPSFISQCIHMCPNSVGARDKDGMTPIHILCQGYKKSYLARWPGKTAEKNMEHIVWMIYRHAPATIVFEDSNGVSAIEYALEAEVNIEFFKAIQHLIIHFNQNNARKIALRKRQETEACQGKQDKAARRPRAAHAA